MMVTPTATHRDDRWGWVDSSFSHLFVSRLSFHGLAAAAAAAEVPLSSAPSKVLLMISRTGAVAKLAN